MSSKLKPPLTVSGAMAAYPLDEVDLLLSKVTGKSREELYLNPQERLTFRQANRLAVLAKLRRAGVPLAYVLESQVFFGLRFAVDQRALIPRPETEALVFAAVSAIGNLGASRLPAKILDIGTGTGCIIISLAKASAKNLRPLEFYGSDVSLPALRLAKSNAKAHQVAVKFLRSDLLRQISFDPDIIIANLPYLSPAWTGSRFPDSRGLRYEPRQALFADQGGLGAIKKLLLQIAARPRPAAVFLEFDPRQKTGLQALISKILPEAKAEFHKDFAGRWRMVGLTFLP